jgi:ABC-2 type transport system ATP-binding protein
VEVRRLGGACSLGLVPPPRSRPARSGLGALDEPTVGLDPVLRRDLWRTFHRLAEGGATLLVSSHVMDEADRCDELLLMRDGQLIAADTPQKIRERTGANTLEEAFLRLVEEAGAHTG